MSNQRKLIKNLAVAIATIYILFLALFAFDSFIPGESLIHNLTGFLIHLIPNIILSLLLIFSWSYPKKGALLYFGFFLVMLIFFRGNSWIIQLLLFSPLLLIGGLFYYSQLKPLD